MYQDRRSLWGWVAGALGVLVIISVLVFMFFFKPESTTTKELSFADALVTLNQERNHLTVTSADREKTVLGEWTLPVHWMQSDRYGNGVYLIEKTSTNEAVVHQLDLSTEFVDLKEKYRFTYEFTDNTEITLDEDSLTLYEPSTHTFTYVNTEFFKTEVFNPEKKQVPTAWYSTDDLLYFSVDKMLYVYSWEHQEVVSKMSFEDEIVALFEKESNLYLLNRFGEASHFTTVFKLDPKSLEITALGKLDLTSISLYPTSYVSGTTFFKGIDARSKKEVLATFNPLEDLTKSETLADSILTQSFIFTAHDYLYTTSESGAVEVYSKHTSTPVYELDGSYSEVYPLWYTTTLEEEMTENLE